MASSSGNNDDMNSSGFLSDNSAYLLGDDVDDTEGQDDDEDSDRTGVLREQDRFLPIANVARLMKKAIPVTGKIAKDSRECVQECVSEFVSFVTSEASDRCHQEKRKTINGEDILFAMSSLGFDNYIEPLKIYLQKYRDATKGDKVAVDDAVLMAAVGTANISNIAMPSSASTANSTPSASSDDANFSATQTKTSPTKK